jgi:hypothetical protein
MKNLLTYENWKLNEANKAVEFFRDHPELLSKHASGISPHKTDWKPEIDSSIESERANKAKDIFLNKIKRIDGIDELFDPSKKGGAEWTIGEVLVGKKEGWSSWYDWDYFVEAFTKSRNIMDFIESASVRKRSFKFPGEDYSTQKDVSQYSKFYSVLKNNFDELQKAFRWLNTALEGIKGSAKRGYINDLMELGLSERDVYIAMTYVKEWTSMSRKRLDPTVWPLLQKISVDSKLLPKYAYRGIFYDGAKIKDPVKWAKQWYPGAKPGVSQGKATSWTIDRGTAISFMTDQDFIKDRDGGYYMLLKIELDPKTVICDLRNLPVDHTFWNQQELIISPEARNYEVDTMIPGKEGYEIYRQFCNENPGGQGAMGSTRAMTAARFLLSPFDQVSISDRMEMKKICKMTVAEFSNEYPGARINTSPKWQKIGMPLWNYIDRHFWRNLSVEFGSRTEVKFRIIYGLDDLSYSSAGPEIHSLYEKIQKETNFNQFYGKDNIQSNVGTITLVNDDYYNIDIEVEWPTEFNLVKGGKKPEDNSEPREEDNKTDSALKQIFDGVGGSRFFVNWSKTKQVEKGTQLSRNVNIQIS